jgi:hypothetical protein
MEMQSIDYTTMNDIANKKLIQQLKRDSDAEKWLSRS